MHSTYCASYKVLYVLCGIDGYERMSLVVNFSSISLVDDDVNICVKFTLAMRTAPLCDYLS